MLPLPCMLVCRFVCANRTRDRGCSKHPVFPAPSDRRGREVLKQISGAMRRENAKSYPRRMGGRQTAVSKGEGVPASPLPRAWNPVPGPP